MTMFVWDFHILKLVHQPAMAPCLWALALPLNGTHVYNIYENVKYSNVSVRHLKICRQIFEYLFYASLK